jgi:hypothetical protein
MSDDERPLRRTVLGSALAVQREQPGRRRPQQLERRALPGPRLRVELLGLPQMLPRVIAPGRAAPLPRGLCGPSASNSTLQASMIHSASPVFYEGRL